MALSSEQDRIQDYQDLLDSIAPTSGDWVSAVEPIVSRFEVGAKFGQDVVHNPEGSRALAELLMSMARILDSEIMARRDIDAG